MQKVFSDVKDARDIICKMKKWIEVQPNNPFDMDYVSDVLNRLDATIDNFNDFQQLFGLGE